MSVSLKSQSISGVIWSSIERFSLIGIQFVLQIFLARLLTPKDYGIIGMLAVFLGISQTFIDSGFTNALIQNQKRTEKDFSTAFFFNVFVAFLFYAVLFFSAPFIAEFYEMPELESVARVLGWSFIIPAFSAVHRTILTIRVDFKTQAKVSFVAALISGIVGVTLAYLGFGVWALVTQTLVNASLATLLLWFAVKWKPISFFSTKAFMPMFSFGYKLLIGNLIHTVYSNLYPLIIGKVFTADVLGHYSRADHLASFPASTSAGILGRVTFPLLATIQDDDVRLNSIYRRYLRISAGAIFPVMFGLAALSKPLIVSLLGEKWLPTVPMMQIFCLGWMLDPIIIVNLNLLCVKGRTDLMLKLEIVKKLTAVAILFSFLPFGLFGLCIGRVVYSHIALVMNTYYTGKFLKMTYWYQMREIFPTFAFSILAGGAAYGITLVVSHPILQLFLGTLLGAAVYITSALLLKFDVAVEGVKLLRTIREKLPIGNRG